MSVLEQFNHQIIGRGPNRIVFLHGLMGAGANWRKVTHAFEKDHEILIFDQRGHGRSFHPPIVNGEGYRPEDFAEDLKEIADELGWLRFRLVGHSMGGRNAQAFTVKYPACVEALVIEDIGPESVPGAAERIFRTFDRIPTPFANKTEARDFFNNVLPNKLTDWPQPNIISQFLYMNIIEKPDGTADWRFSREGIMATVAAGRLHDRWAEFNSIRVPTLLIRGEQSDELSASLFNNMIASNPFVRGTVIPNSGHWVHNDQPDFFAKAVTEFFQGL